MKLRKRADRTRGDPSGGAREEFFARAAGTAGYVSVEADGLTFLVETADAGVGRSLFLQQRRVEMRHLARALKQLDLLGLGDAARAGVFLDVGANIGTTTLPAIGPNGFDTAVALEPFGANARLLRANAALNGLEDRVLVLELAASDDNGTAILRQSKTNSGAHKLVSSTKPGREHVTVRRVTLDSLGEAGHLDPDRVGLVWVDAQRHEGAVLRGAHNLISRGVPWVLEVTTDPESEGRAVFEDIATQHYTHVLDLRSKDQVMPVDRLGELFARHTSAHQTDALLVRI